MKRRFAASLAALAVALAFSPLLTAAAAESDVALRAKVQAHVSQYLASRTKAEHISAISMSIQFADDGPNLNVTAGRTQYAGAGVPVIPSNLYQIGSNTKAFTSAAILQLEAEGKLTIAQTVGKWLPQYPAWKNITIRRLLDMTSDIPTYDADNAMLSSYAADPMRNWTTAQLVAVIYPRLQPNAGWLYSNTAYILCEMIIERVTGKSYASEIDRRLLHNPAIGLRSTFYQPSFYPKPISDRLVSGYYFNDDPDSTALAPLLGKDTKSMSLSWTQGAGGIVSSPEDLTKWVRALYEGPILADKQRKEMETMVSQKTGKPISQTTPDDPHGFGLGLAALYVPAIGHFWFYEGETLGYRFVHAYFPKSRVIIVVGLNSQPPKKQDHVGMLVQSVYADLKAAGKV